MKEYRCYYCKETKSETEFTKGSRSANQPIQGKCRPCNLANAKKYQFKGAHPEPTVTEKRCPRCETVKPRADWNRNTASATGLQAYCRECQKSFPSQQPGWRAARKLEAAGTQDS